MLGMALNLARQIGFDSAPILLPLCFINSENKFRYSPEDDVMRTLAIIIAAFAVLQFPQLAEAGNLIQPGGGQYVDTNHPKATKDYYVVREGQNDKCKVVNANFGDKPLGAIGGAPYVSKKYATAALKKFPECKGGEADDSMDTKKHRKKGE